MHLSKRTIQKLQVWMMMGQWNAGKQQTKSKQLSCHQSCATCWFTHVTIHSFASFTYLTTLLTISHQMLVSHQFTHVKACYQDAAYRENKTPSIPDLLKCIEKKCNMKE